MPRKSSIKTLPPEIRGELDRILADGRFTLDEIVAHLRQLGASVSRDAVWRYGKEYERVRQKLTESREIASAFARELGELPQGDMGRVLIELLHTVTFKVLMAQADGEGDGAPSVTTEDIMFLARSIRDTTSALKGSAELEIRIRDKAAKEAAARAEKAVAEQGAKHGFTLPPAALKAIREQVYGIVG